jgi:hypothetical protein
MQMTKMMAEDAKREQSENSITIMMTKHMVNALITKIRTS